VVRFHLVIPYMNAQNADRRAFTHITAGALLTVYVLVAVEIVWPGLQNDKMTALKRGVPSLARS
jgi:hypothetical protein